MVVHIAQVRSGGFVGDIHRMLQRQVPDGEGLKFCVAGLDAAAVLLVQLAEAGGHLAAAGTGSRHHDERPRGLDVFIFAVAFFADDGLDVEGIAGDDVVMVDPDAELAETGEESVGGRLSVVLGEDDAADVEELVLEKKFCSALFNMWHRQADGEVRV